MIGGVLALVIGVLGFVLTRRSDAKSGDTRGAKDERSSVTPRASTSSGTAPVNTQAGGARGQSSDQQTPTSITKPQMLRVQRDGKTEVAFASPSGDVHRFSVRKQQGAQTYTIALIEDGGKQLATVNTYAESDAAVLGVRHWEPVAGVGVVNGSLVFVGGAEKTTGKAGWSIEGRVFRWDESGTLKQVQALSQEAVASEHDDLPAPAPSEGPQPLRVVTGKCDIDQALIGLDKATVVCSVGNPNPRVYAVHVTGELVSDNLPPHSESTDIAAPAHGVKDAKLEFQSVDSGRSKNLHCICKATSPDGIAIQ